MVPVAVIMMATVMHSLPGSEGPGFAADSEVPGTQPG